MSAGQILASSLLMGIFLLIVGLTGAIDVIARITPKSVVRGVQLSTGALLISGGVKFMIGTSRFQILQNAVEPHLNVQAIGPVPVGLVIGGIGAVITLLFINSRKYPAGLIVVAGGIVTGLALGARVKMGIGDIGFNIPATVGFNIDFNPFMKY